MRALKYAFQFTILMECFTLVVIGRAEHSDLHEINKSFAATADILVFRAADGSISARRATTDEILASDGDASRVIQSAIDSLPTTGGKIFIGAGSYELSRTIIIKNKHGVHLSGAARGIIFSGGREGTCLWSSSAIDLVHVEGEKIKVAGITFSNLHLVGSGKENGKAGIVVTGRSDLLSLYQVGANHCGVGFYLKGGGPAGGVVDAPQIQFCDPQVNGIGLKIEHAHYPKVVGGEFSDCVLYGIVLSSPDLDHGRCMNVKILGVTAVRNGQGGILIGSNTDSITVSSGCDFGGSPHGSGVILVNDQGGRAPQNILLSDLHTFNNKYAGILVEQGAHILIANCLCSGHDHIGVRRHEGQDWGIKIDSDAKDVVLTGNLCYGNAQADEIAVSTDSADKNESN